MEKCDYDTFLFSVNKVKRDSHQLDNSPRDSFNKKKSATNVYNCSPYADDEIATNSAGILIN